jgi:hypothetical protein
MTITTRRISVLGCALALLAVVVLLSFRGCSPTTTAAAQFDGVHVQVVGTTGIPAGSPTASGSTR